MSRQKSGFEKLEVYRLSEELADMIYACVRHWPILDRDTVGKQIIRAADSIGANIAEGYGRASAPDNRRCVRIAIGSLYETKHWLRRAFKRSFLKREEVSRLSQILDKLLPMTNADLRSISARIRIPTPGLQPPTYN